MRGGGKESRELSKSHRSPAIEIAATIAKSTFVDSDPTPRYGLPRSSAIEIAATIAKSTCVDSDPTPRYGLPRSSAIEIAATIAKSTCVDYDPTPRYGLPRSSAIEIAATLAKSTCVDSDPTPRYGLPRSSAIEIAATIAKSTCVDSDLTPQAIVAVSTALTNPQWENTMRAPYTQLYVHLCWSTWDRLPLVSDLIEERIHAAIAVKCRQLKCEPLAIGGVADHLHVLVRMHPAVSVSLLVKEVKGASSHLVTHEITPGDFFKWQGAYRAFTIRKEEAETVKKYILNQKTHHREGSLIPDWELISEDGGT